MKALRIHGNKDIRYEDLPEPNTGRSVKRETAESPIRPSAPPTSRNGNTVRFGRSMMDRIRLAVKRCPSYSDTRSPVMLSRLVMGLKELRSETELS